jgi:hypothetical protein
MYNAEVILDSIGPNDKRIITVKATYPRCIHSELLTHRMFARNSASSRAIPWKRKGKEKLKIKDMPKGALPIGNGIHGEISLNPDDIYEYYVPNCMYTMIMTDPFVPTFLGKEQKGMQSGDELEDADREQAIKLWLEARNEAVSYADRLYNLNLHKSLCNRITEPWMWITVIITATEWNNFTRLRVHPAAEKHFNHIAKMIIAEIEKSTPRRLEDGNWHLPYLTTMADNPDFNLWGGEEGLKIQNALQDYRIEIELDNPAYSGKSWGEIGTLVRKKISAARCARVSYLTHDGIRDWSADLKLFSTLIERTDGVIHASPLEHVNQATKYPELWSGCMNGWKQFRKEYALENVPGAP